MTTENKPCPEGLPFFVAHTPTEDRPKTWHSLEKHTRKVASLAEEFAEPFGGAILARYLGLIHDLGKFDDNFQRYLLLCHLADRKRWAGEKASAPRAGSAPHKQAGALYISETNLPLAPQIAQALSDITVGCGILLTHSAKRPSGS